MNNPAPSYILTVVCPDKIGIVAAVAGYLTSRKYFIEESSHFGDRDTGTFFMRTRFASPDGSFSRSGFGAGFADHCDQRFQRCTAYNGIIDHHHTPVF